MIAAIAVRLKTYAGFVKIEHTIFSLPLIYAGTLLGAHGRPSARVLLLILVAAVGARAAAMGLNRLIDLELDRRNPRTKQRELPRGAMQVWEGRFVVMAGSVVYLAGAAALAPICLALAPIPLALFVGYPYLKRFTSLSHLGLGLAWSTGPLAGWLAASGSLANFADVVWLWLFSLLWVAGFDVIYATMDEAFDREAGLHSLPARLGKRRALNVALILHAAAFLALVILWRDQLRSPVALPWLVGIGLLFLWQHAVAEKNPGFAFFQLNGIIGFVVFGFVWAGI
ncbi:MAG: UbiA family prenyltransferase [Candidatus Omnitrophica bacterium]|nr:UbiA family prenyltransferase [Candidatus Omnitrophota bacterium]